MIPLIIAAIGGYFIGDGLKNPVLKFAKGGELENEQMVEIKAKEIMHHSKELIDTLKGDNDVPAWVVTKAERASSDLSDITHYLDGVKESKSNN